MVGPVAPLAVLQDTHLRMVLDYAGVAVFAATGALAAARRGFDIITFAFFAAITGIGGGTLRDLLLGAPVFWVGDAGYVGVCIAAAGVVWALGEGLSRFRTLLWLDALGLAAYCVVGASKAADCGAPPLVAVVMGVLTASFGGMVRDVLAGEPSVLLRKEIYVTAAVAGAGSFVLARLLGAPDLVAAVIGALVAFALRAGALAQGWTLPGFGGVSGPAMAAAAPIAAPTAIIVPADPPPAAPAGANEFPPPEAPEPVIEAVSAAPAPAPKPPRPRKPRAQDLTGSAGSVGPPRPPRRPRKPKPDES